MNIKKYIKKSLYLYDWNRNKQRYQYQCKCSPNTWFVFSYKNNMKKNCEFCNSIYINKREVSILKALKNVLNYFRQTNWNIE